MSKFYQSHVLLPALRAIMSKMAKNGWKSVLETETTIEGNKIIATSQLIWYKNGLRMRQEQFDAECRKIYENSKEN